MFLTDIQIAGRNLTRHRRRNLLLGGALAAVTALLVLLGALTAGMEAAMMESALDFARTTQGAVSFEPGPVDIAEVARDVAHDLFILAEEKRIRLEVKAPKALEVNGDELKLKQVLQNLIDNAAKFMGNQPSPRIEIGQRGSRNNMTVFYVQDNGIGILLEMQNKIFDLFSQSHRAVGREQGGIGVYGEVR